MPQVPDVPEAFLLYTASNPEPGLRRAAEGELMRVFLADDTPKVRFALKAMLQQRSEIVVVGEAKDAGELSTRLAAAQADLLLIDWRLPGLAETGSIPELRSEHLDLMIVVLSGRPEDVHEALSSGADDFVSKIDPPESLLAATGACIRQLEERQAVRA